jgi:hypothetical protein
VRGEKLTSLVSPLVEKLHGVGKRVVPGMNLVARVPVGADLNRVGGSLGSRHGRKIALKEGLASKEKSTKPNQTKPNPTRLGWGGTVRLMQMMKGPSG